VFDYEGAFPELKAALDANRDRMIAAYRKTLGSEMFSILEQADATLLGPESFQSIQAMSRGMPDETTPGANKFFLACRNEGKVGLPKFEKTGRFICPPLAAAPGFIFSEKGFEGSRKRYERWIDPYLAPYIHEYDHFLLFAIQEKPMIVAMQILAENFKIPRMPLCLEDIEGTIMAHSTRREKRMMALQLLTWAYVFQEFYEISTRALDREIFLAMGLSVPRNYFEVPPKALFPYPMEKIGAIPVLPFGDVFHGKSLEHRLTTIRFWIERFRPSSRFQVNFMESFAKLAIRKCSYGELKR